MKTISLSSHMILTDLNFTRLLLLGFGSAGTVALSTRGNLIGVPTTKAVQATAQLNATIDTLPALQSLAGSAKCDVTGMQINYQTPACNPVR